MNKMYLLLVWWEGHSASKGNKKKYKILAQPTI